MYLTELFTNNSPRPLTVSLSTLAVAAACAALSPLANAQIKYEIITPEVHGKTVSKTQSHGNEINDNGQTLLNNLTTFAVWQNEESPLIVRARSTDEAIPSQLTAASINDSMQVVGSKTFYAKSETGSNFITVPFYWDADNGLVNLDELGDISESGLSSTHLFGINANGNAIGTTSNYEGDAANGTRGFVWSLENGEQTIPTLSSINGASATYPQAINNNGTVAGFYHNYSGSIDSYYERGFIYDSANGSQSLEAIDADFFQASNITARAINNSDLVIGELDRNAYIYDIAKSEGQQIQGFGENAAARAYAINDHGVVAGYAEVIESGTRIGHAPMLWTKETGSINLNDYLNHDASTYLPEGIDQLDCIVTPKSINEHGQISAQLNTAGYSKEIIINPVLDFQWTSIERVFENGIPGVLYTHTKSTAPGTLPLSALGLELAYHCSSDLKNWNEIDANTNGIRIFENETTVELFAPLSDCTFIQVSLK